MKRASKRDKQRNLDACCVKHSEGAEPSSNTQRSIRNRILKFYFGNQEGQSLVEFALVAPLLLAVLTGLFEFGIAFNNQLTLTQAVGAGAQYLQSLGAGSQGTTDPCKSVITALEGAAPNLVASNISLTLTMNGTTAKGNSCSGDQSDLVQNTAVTVLATYPCHLSIFGYPIVPNCQLSAQVSEYEY